MTWRRGSDSFYSGLAFLLFFGGFGVWETLSRTGAVSPLFFPAPSTVAVTLKDMLVAGELTGHVKATLSRVFIGFLVGGLMGYLVGMVMGFSTRARRVFDPFIAALHPVPKISLLPIIMIVLGIGMVSRTFVVALSTFFPMVINTMAGVKQIHPIYFEVARNYGAGRRQIFRKVVVPGSLPFVLAGARLALNVALSLTIAVELLTAKDGIGTMIWLSWQTLRIEELYVGVALAAMIGIGIRLLVQFLSARLVRWQVETNG